MVFWLQINICLSNGSLATDVTRLSHKKKKEILHFLFATISSLLITMVSWLSSIKLCTLEKRELLVLEEMLQSLHPTGSDYLSSHCWLCLRVLSRRLSHWSHPWKIKGSRFDQWCKKYWQITVVVFFCFNLSLRSKYWLHSMMAKDNMKCMNVPDNTDCPIASAGWAAGLSPSTCSLSFSSLINAKINFVCKHLAADGLRPLRHSFFSSGGLLLTAHCGCVLCATAFATERIFLLLPALDIWLRAVRSPQWSFSSDIQQTFP